MLFSKKQKLIFFSMIILVIISITILPEDISASDKNIIINLPAFRLSLYEGDRLIRDYPIAIGKPSSATPTGSTEIINLVTDPTFYPRNWYNRGLSPVPPGPDNPVGSRWLGLSWAHYGIHGTNEPDSIKNSITSGCIRMYNEDVEELQRLIAIGTRVEIKYNLIELYDPDNYNHLQRWGADLPVEKRNKTGFILYPDVYRQGDYTNTVLKQINDHIPGGDDFILPVLQQVLNNGFLLSSTGFVEAANRGEKNKIFLLFNSDDLVVDLTRDKDDFVFDLVANKNLNIVSVKTQKPDIEKIQQETQIKQINKEKESIEVKPAYFTIDIKEFPVMLSSHQKEIKIEYKIANIGQTSDSQNIIFQVNGNQKKNIHLTLEADSVYSNKYTYFLDDKTLEQINFKVASNNQIAYFTVYREN